MVFKLRKYIGSIRPLEYIQFCKYVGFIKFHCVSTVNTLCSVHDYHITTILLFTMAFTSAILIVFTMAFTSTPMDD